MAVKTGQRAQNLVSDQTYPVLRLEGPNVYQKILRDQVYTLWELEGPKTYFSLLLIMQNSAAEHHLSGNKVENKP